MTKSPLLIKYIMSKHEMHPLIDKERQKTARQYHLEHLKVSIISTLISGIFLLALLLLNISRDLVEIFDQMTHARFFVVLLYFILLFVFFTLISFPFTFASGYVIEHKFGFSNQTLKDWFKDELKSFFLGLILGLIVFEILCFITLNSPKLWWFWLSLIMIFFSVIIANLMPVVILPLFYKTSPLEDGALKEKIGEMCRKAGMNTSGINKIDLSSRSTKANAAVVGLGNTKRILIGDTLMQKYTEQEILSTLAHEITHYEEHHIWQLIFWQSLMTLVTLYIFYLIYPAVYHWAGFKDASEIAAFPVFALIFSASSFVLKPLGSAISRYYERRADAGALRLTDDPESMITLMAKFCNNDLAIAYPNPIIEWYSYSHPSIGKRIEFAEKWEKRVAGTE